MCISIEVGVDKRSARGSAQETACRIPRMRGASSVKEEAHSGPRVIVPDVLKFGWKATPTGRPFILQPTASKRCSPRT